jgi:hypothetical protein
MVTRLFCLFFLYYISSFSFAATVTTLESGNDCVWSGVVINGTIEVGDNNKFRKALVQLHSKYGIKNCSSGQSYVIIKSDGGDVDESILIGKEIRKNNLGVIIKQDSNCYSSCVLILAGGVNKIIMGQVGVHRPYFSLLNVGKNIDEVRKLRDGINQRIKNYLNYVDVPETLLEEMLAHLPENIKLLSNQDLVRFRLIGKDATQDEIDTANIANHYNLSSAEYRRRMSNFETKCPNLFLNDQLTARAQFCMYSVILNITEAEVERRMSKVKSNCSSFSGEQSKICIRNILVLNN